MLIRRSRCLSRRQGKQCPEPGFLVTYASFANSVDCPPDRYTAHSLRIGTATTVAASALVLTLKVMGRWSSAAYERYRRPDVRAILDAQKAMSSSL